VRRTREAEVLRRPSYKGVLPGSALLVLLSGCASSHQAEVERVASTFADPAADPGERCDLLAPTTLASFEESASAPCAEAIGELPTDDVEVGSVEIWGGDAQVALADDTVFLTETDTGWRVTAAVCRVRTDAPYDCEVEP
jgi:hypothetical protein